MRTKLYVTVLLILSLIGGGFLWFQGKGRVADPLLYLPDDTLALVDMRRPAAIYDAYRRSRLGKRVNAIRWAGLLRDFGLSDTDALRVQKDVDQVQDILSGPVAQELLSRRAVLALLPPTFSAGGEGDGVSYALTSLVLIAQPKHRSDIIEVATPLLAGGAQVASDTYRGTVLKTFALDDQLSLTVAASHGLFLASFSSAAVKQCLDLGQGDEKASAKRLHDNAGYQELRQLAEGHDDEFVYAGQQVISLLVPRYVSNGQTHADKLLTQEGQDAKGGAMFCATESERLRCTAIIQSESGKGNTEGVRREPIPPAIDVSLITTPAKLAMHYWTNRLDLPGMASGLANLPQLEGLSQSMEEWLNRKAGMSLQQYLSLFGSEYSITVTGMNSNGLFLRPRFYGRLSVKDQKQLQQDLDRMMAGRPLQKKEVAGITMHTLMLAGGMAQPSYAFRQEFFYFADSPESLSQALLPMAEPLTATEVFRKADIDLAKPSNMICYGSSPQLQESLQQLASWSALILAMIDHEHGGRSMSLVDQVVVPVLDGMKMFAAGSARMVSSEQRMVVDAALVYGKTDDGNE